MTILVVPQTIRIVANCQPLTIKISMIVNMNEMSSIYKFK